MMSFRKYEVIVMDLLTKLIIIGLVLILVAIIVKNIFFIPKKKNIQKGEINMEPPRYYQQPNMNAQFNPYPMQSLYQPVHYPAVRVISIVLQIFSFFVFAASLVGAIVILSTHFISWTTGLVVLLVGIVNALILLAISELIKVFADISISTRATLNHFLEVTLRKTQEENKQ